MYKSVNPLFLISQTPMHAGSGDSLGIVDMPIQRERHTSFPKIEGSSLKGAIRENVEQFILNNYKKNSETEEGNSTLEQLITKSNKAFGYDDADLKGFSQSDIRALFPDKKERDFSGALAFTDARLLLFPVKSMKGVFAWITCPKVLQQFAEDIALSSTTFDKDTKQLFQNVIIDEGKASVAESTNLKIGLENDYKIILEEYAFKADLEKENGVITKLAEWLETNIFSDAVSYIKNKIKKDIVILDDDAFKDFVNLSTEVITRTKISNVTGTVDKETGALFTEEYLPSETVMYSLVLAADEFTKNETKLTQNEIVTFFDENLPTTIQIGGNATIGKGLTKTYLMKGGTKND